MLKRFHHYSESNPLHAWLLTVGLLVLFNSCLLWAVPRLRKPEMIGLFLCYALTTPTIHLVRRFSEEQRKQKPIALRQERAVGVLSVIAVLCSVGALATVAVGERAGLHPSENAGLGLLFAFAVTLMLGVVFGAATRHMRVGLWGFRMAVAWFGLVLALPLSGAAVYLFRKWM